MMTLQTVATIIIFPMLAAMAKEYGKHLMAS